MARHTLSVDEQIRGAEKALANPKTPKQFLPSLRAKLEKLRAGKTARGSR